MILKSTEISAIAELLLNGKIGILPTDTIYGIHCLGLRSDLIQKVKDIKNKQPNMPVITLISDISQINQFGIMPTEFELSEANKLWPGPNTLIFVKPDGTEKSFRLPKNDFIISLLKLTGPLSSTSANLHGQPHSKDITQAQQYFGDSIDFYVDGGTLDNPPSNIYMFSGNELKKIR